MFLIFIQLSLEFIATFSYNDHWVCLVFRSILFEFLVEDIVYFLEWFLYKNRIDSYWLWSILLFLYRLQWIVRVRFKIYFPLFFEVWFFYWKIVNSRLNFIIIKIRYKKWWRPLQVFQRHHCLRVKAIAKRSSIS
jgi:hypothetical protein